MASTAPIGIFDSGVGGLSVFQAVRAELPGEDLLYVADSAHVPYAKKSPDFIVERATAICRFLIDRGAKAIVIACNTATGVAIDSVRAQYSVPIVGIEPAVKPAAAATRSAVVGVLATQPTLESPRFQRLISQHAPNVVVLTQACPGLAEQVEEGDLGTPETRAMIAQYVRPLLERGADTIVLGCTHYPFLRSVIESVAGERVAILDPALAVARELGRRLRAGDALSDRGGPGAEQFFTSGEPDRVSPVISRLLGRPVPVMPLPDLL